MKRIELKAWMVPDCDKQPSIYAKRRWARAGRIWPPAKKEGRSWTVVHTARKADRDDPVLKSGWGKGPVWETERP